MTGAAVTGHSGTPTGCALSPEREALQAQRRSDWWRARLAGHRMVAEEGIVIITGDAKPFLPPGYDVVPGRGAMWGVQLRTGHGATVILGHHATHVAACRAAWRDYKARNPLHDMF